MCVCGCGVLCVYVGVVCVVLCSVLCVYVVVVVWCVYVFVCVCVCVLCGVGMWCVCGVCMWLCVCVVVCVCCVVVCVWFNLLHVVCKTSLFTERDKFESTAIRLWDSNLWPPLWSSPRHHGTLLPISFLEN